MGAKQSGKLAGRSSDQVNETQRQQESCLHENIRVPSCPPRRQQQHGKGQKDPVPVRAPGHPYERSTMTPEVRPGNAPADMTHTAPGDVGHLAKHLIQSPRRQKKVPGRSARRPDPAQHRSYGRPATRTGDPRGRRRFARGNSLAEMTQTEPGDVGQLAKHLIKSPGDKKVPGRIAGRPDRAKNHPYGRSPSGTVRQPF